MSAKTRRALNLGKHDAIVVAWAESAAGPGWANRPLWVIVLDGDGELRRECLQPDEQPEAAQLLYAINEATTAAMTKAIREAVRS